MLWVVVLLLLLLGLAVGILAVVALPHLRSGSQVLTPQGERLVREARSRMTSTGAARR